MILAGKSKAEIIDALKAAYAKKEFPALEPGGMSYMMSKKSFLTDGPATDDVQDNDKPLAVLLKYEHFLAMQERMPDEE
jgi:hypothetical protein